MRRLRLGLVVTAATLVSGGALLACGADAPPPAVAAPFVDAGPPETDAAMPAIALPTLRTGDVAPKTAASLTLAPQAKEIAGGWHYLAIPLPAELPRTGGFVRLEGPGTAFVENGNGEASWLWIRRPAGAASAEVKGQIDFAYDRWNGLPGQVQPFVVDLSAKATTPATPPTKASKDPLAVRWADAAVRSFSMAASSLPFAADATARLQRLADKQRPATKGPRARVDPRNVVAERQHESASEIDSRLGVLSGGSAYASSVATSAWFVARKGATRAEQRQVPFATVKAVALPAIPWNQLTPVGAPPPEPLATLIPAEFYYLRARDLAALESVLETLETWGNVADKLVDGSIADDQIVTRYETALGVRRGALVQLLGGTAVGEVALAGSDVYLPEGSDLSLVLEVRTQPLVDTALATGLSARAAGHGEVTETTRIHGGVTVRESRTADGAVRRQRADVGGRTIVSTSAVALDRILDTLAGQHPRLSDEPDFQHMMARDPLAHVSALAFAGDRFFAEITGPRQRILEARRRAAREELVGLGNAALLQGWSTGREPATVAEIVRAGLLTPDETRHATGEPISFTPGSAPRSIWGTPAEMRPLLEIPTPATVTVAEAAAYERFSSKYRDAWSEHLDPLLVRFTVEGKETTLDLRQMPVPWTFDYRDLSTFAGDVRVQVPPLAGGVRLTAAIGKDSELRRTANELAGNLNEKLQHALDWVGDSATVGTFDDRYLAAGVLALDEHSLPEPPPRPSAASSDQERDAVVYQMPLYASIDVNNPIAAGLVVATLRKEIEQEMGDQVHWREVGREGDAVLVGIEAGKGAGFLAGARLFYSFAGGALVLALRQDVLRAVVRERAAGHKAMPVSTGGGGSQHVLELARDPQGGLESVLVWLAEQGALEADAGAARALAAYIYRGAPSVDADPQAFSRLATAYFGGAPRPVDGGAFSFGPDGVIDPSRGTASHPIWPTLPVAGSEVTRAATALTRLRADLSFDPEGKTPLAIPGARGSNRPASIPRSLHARLAFTSR
jgi:hypothetical protein